MCRAAWAKTVEWRWQLSVYCRKTMGKSAESQKGAQERQDRTLTSNPLLSTVQSPCGTCTSPLHTSRSPCSFSSCSSVPVAIRIEANLKSVPLFGFTIGAVRTWREREEEALSGVASDEDEEEEERAEERRWKAEEVDGVRASEKWRVEAGVVIGSQVSYR